MRTPSYTRQFERDLRLAQRRGKDIEKLKTVVTALVNEEPLAEHYYDHPLKGNYRDGTIAAHVAWPPCRALIVRR